MPTGQNMDLAVSPSKLGAAPHPKTGAVLAVFLDQCAGLWSPKKRHRFARGFDAISRQYVSHIWHQNYRCYCFPNKTATLGAGNVAHFACHCWWASAKMAGVKRFSAPMLGSHWLEGYGFGWQNHGLVLPPDQIYLSPNGDAKDG